MSESFSRQSGNRLVHHGRGGELFVVFIVNLLLKVVTLGIYHFWAVTRVRRYLWTQTSFDGERLEYTGTGMELFIGFLKAVIIMAGVVLLLTLTMMTPFLGMLAIIAVYLGFPVLMGFATFSAQRYRLTRTRLRGIRFGLAGSAWEHGLKVLGYGLLTALTLGLYTPFMRMKLTAHMFDNTRFGSLPFSFEGRGGDLFGRFLLTVLLTIPTLGLVWLWYRAAEYRYTLSKLSAGDLRFEVVESDFSLAWFFLTNILIVVLTLGLGTPWVTTRTLRHLGENVRISGNVDYASVLQSEDESDAVGEGFAEALGAV